MEMSIIFRKYLVLFGGIFLVVPLEGLMEYVGITHPEPVDDDGKMMSVFGKVLMFVAYYGTIVYFEYRRIKKIEKAED